MYYCTSSFLNKICQLLAFTDDSWKGFLALESPMGKLFLARGKKKIWPPWRMRCEALTAVKVSTLIFWVVTPCGPTYCLHGQELTFLRNAGVYPHEKAATQPRRPTSTFFNNNGLRRCSTWTMWHWIIQRRTSSLKKIQYYKYLFSLFCVLNYLTTLFSDLDNIASNERMTGEWCSGKEVDESGHGLIFKVLYQHLLAGTEENHNSG
jgi:hypothetical protein